MAPSMENFYGNSLAIQTGIVKFNSILAPNRVSYYGAQQILQIQSLIYYSYVYPFDHLTR
ncbi:hypothetical protein HanXRQr2_Chr03g0128501 [Helianthus annuus]|uniref:Uncharacterized protein n=1 Tax=Helianthus annuus TaxID=4232 RepID=A0A251VCM2_HELAN|nr:hypothetical protein HanXRQr2_Chr03g0128501 [Helianthus annuus]KAJ0945182.1 hypothetical protein HanPSC8_Chr03g0125251 [Helianthus annuus]